MAVDDRNNRVVNIPLDAKLVVFIESELIAVRWRKERDRHIGDWTVAQLERGREVEIATSEKKYDKSKIQILICAGRAASTRLGRVEVKGWDSQRAVCLIRRECRICRTEALNGSTLLDCKISKWNRLDRMSRLT